MTPLHIVRRTLQQALPFEAYLAVLSAGFLAPDRLGVFAPIHARVRFLRRVVGPGAVCIDVGANLGYFTVPLSRLVGERGRVYAVEPVAAFRRVLRANVRRFGRPERVAILPVALGPDDGADVRLATAEVGGVARHGMTRIVAGSPGAGGPDEAPGYEGGAALTHTATMRRPDALFGHLDRLDFLKCDIEGFETEVMPLFADLVARHRPVIEVEAGSAASQDALRARFEPLGYVTCTLRENGLVRVGAGRRADDAELYFWPTSRGA